MTFRTPAPKELALNFIADKWLEQENIQINEETIKDIVGQGFEDYNIEFVTKYDVVYLCYCMAYGKDKYEI